MKSRSFWLDRIESAWRQKPIIWLAGVRRSGKTTLCRSLKDIEYFDCELPSVRRTLEDPESFLASFRGRRIVLDEVHRLDNPSEILKIAADHFPGTKIIATGSSVLGASSKFRDTLTGRKVDLHLTPMIWPDTEDLGKTDLTHRLLRGGLPPFFLAERHSESEIQEWISSYWAKDVQELFHLEKRHGFLKFAEMLMSQSGGIFMATKFTGPCGISHTSVANYLEVLQATFLARVVRPYHTNRQNEIVSAPKVYGFDTGFVCHYRGWEKLRPEDKGELWENYVLNELSARTQQEIQYWRDKQGHEIDFVIGGRKGKPTAIECKWSVKQFDPKNLAVFRRHHPKGENFLVAPDVVRPSTRTFAGLEVKCVGLRHLDGLTPFTKS